MTTAEFVMTKDGLKELELELETLKTVKRREVAERIKQAIEFGDISENSEYEDAKNEQAFIEGRIQALEKKLTNVRVIDSSDVDVNIVSEYATIAVLNLDDSQTCEYQIVGSVEAKPFENKISNESPVGKALLGHQVGDVVEVAVPAGQINLKIVSIYK